MSSVEVMMRKAPCKYCANHSRRAKFGSLQAWTDAARMDRGFAYGCIDIRYALSREINATDTFVKSRGCVKQAATRTRKVSQSVRSSGYHLLEAATPVIELSVGCHEQ